MAKVQVPGTNRFIEFDLHEVQIAGDSVFESITHLGLATPQKFAEQFADALTPWTFSPPVAVLFKKDGYKENAARAARFQKARGLRGRPYSSFVSRVEDFAVLVLYFESLGFKQGTRQARLYWEKHGQITPLQNHIEKALKEVRLWVGPELASWVPLIRAKYRLTGVPKAARPKRNT